MVYPSHKCNKNVCKNKITFIRTFMVYGMIYILLQTFMFLMIWLFSAVKAVFVIS